VLTSHGWRARLDLSHRQEVRYQIHLPETATHKLIDPASLYIHPQVPQQTAAQSKGAAG
jgi:hypothetical protein